MQSKVAHTLAAEALCIALCCLSADQQSHDLGWTRRGGYSGPTRHLAAEGEALLLLSCVHGLGVGEEGRDPPVSVTCARLDGASARRRASAEQSLLHNHGRHCQADRCCHVVPGPAGWAGRSHWLTRQAADPAELCLQLHIVRRFLTKGCCCCCCCCLVVLNYCVCVPQHAALPPPPPPPPPPCPGSWGH